MTFENTNNEDRQVYFIGGGLASLAGAAYLVRDCNFKGENIHIIEGMKILEAVMMVQVMPKMVMYVVVAEC